MAHTLRDVTRRVADWLRLEDCLFGNAWEERTPDGRSMKRGDPGCSEVRGILLGMGLGHVGAALRGALEAQVRGVMRRRYTEALRRLDEAENEVRERLKGSPEGVVAEEIAVVRARKEHAVALRDRAEYRKADREMLDQEITVGIYQMRADRVFPGWGAACADGEEWDGDAAAGALEIPMRHLATLLEFEVIVDDAAVVGGTGAPPPAPAPDPPPSDAPDGTARRRRK